MKTTLIYSSENLHFYKYAPKRYYVYTITGVPIGDIYFLKESPIYEPSSNTIYAYQWLDELSDFLKLLLKGEYL